MKPNPHDLPDLLKSQTLARAFAATPSLFSQSIDQTLHNLENQTEAPVMKKKLAAVPITILVILLLCMGAVFAMGLSPTADIFGWFYGDEFGEELFSGQSAMVDQSKQLGDITYTVNEIVYKDGVIYGVATVETTANVILLPEDASVTEPAGYGVFSHQPAPEGAKSYVELAREQNAKIVFVKLVPNGAIIDGRTCAGTVGYFWNFSKDNTVQYSFEVHVGEEYEEYIPQADSYELSLHIANWEVTQDGAWLRDGPAGTLLQAEWIVSSAQ